MWSELKFPTEQKQNRWLETVKLKFMRYFPMFGTCFQFCMPLFSALKRTFSSLYGNITVSKVFATGALNTKKNHLRECSGRASQSAHFNVLEGRLRRIWLHQRLLEVLCFHIIASPRLYGDDQGCMWQMLSATVSASSVSGEQMDSLLRSCVRRKHHLRV